MAQLNAPQTLAEDQTDHIIDQGAFYLMIVKANQVRLQDNLA